MICGSCFALDTRIRQFLVPICCWRRRGRVVRREPWGRNTLGGPLAHAEYIERRNHGEHVSGLGGPMNGTDWTGMAHASIDNGAIATRILENFSQDLEVLGKNVKSPFFRWFLENLDPKIVIFWDFPN